MWFENNTTAEIKQNPKEIEKSRGGGVDRNIISIKEVSWKLVAELKNEVENKKYEKLIKKIQEQINELPEILKKSLLNWKTLHSVKI